MHSTIKTLILFLWISFIVGNVSVGFPVFADDLSNPVITGSEKAIENLNLQRVDIREAIEAIAPYLDEKIDVSPNVLSGQVSANFKSVRPWDALRIVLEMQSLAYIQKDGVVSVITQQEFKQISGQTFSPELQVKIFPVSYNDPEEIVNYLQGTKLLEGRVYPMENPSAVAVLDRASNILEITKLFKEVDVQVFKMVFELGFAKAAQLSAQIKPMLSKYIGKIKIDESANMIVVTDTSSKIEEIRKVVDASDHRDRQVQIDAKVIEIDLNDEHHLGVDWEAIVSDYKILEPDKSLQQNLSQKLKEMKLSVGLIANDDYSILIEALDTVGSVKILSQDNLVTTNNKEIKMFAGQQKADLKADSQPLQTMPIDAHTLDELPLGIKLHITPTIHPDGDTTLKIRMEISSLAKPHKNSKADKGVSEVSVTLRLKKGVMIVIGGIIYEERSSVSKKIPVLGDVPFLGNVFRSYKYDTQQIEQVIFLTPKVSSSDIGTPIHSRK